MEKNDITRIARLPIEEIRAMKLPLPVLEQVCHESELEATYYDATRDPAGPSGDGRGYKISDFMPDVMRNLRENPDITDLYCPAFGTGRITKKGGSIIQVSFAAGKRRFDRYGRLLSGEQILNPSGECILFPSSSQREWPDMFYSMPGTKKESVQKDRTLAWKPFTPITRPIFSGKMSEPFIGVLRSPQNAYMGEKYALCIVPDLRLMRRTDGAVCVIKPEYTPGELLGTGIADEIVLFWCSMEDLAETLPEGYYTR